MGYNVDNQNRLLILSCLYTFPKYRNQGYAKLLVEDIKLEVSKGFGTIQVAVERHKLAYLRNFYLKRGFKTTGTIRTNPKGIGYMDFFWSDREFELIDSVMGTLIKNVE
jgi:GNAT superfamily N-acetyltransferase